MSVLAEVTLDETEQRILVLIENPAECPFCYRVEERWFASGPAEYGPGMESRHFRTLDQAQHYFQSRCAAFGQKRES